MGELNLGILVSGRGSNLEAIAKALKEGRIPNCKIAVVVSSKPDAPALDIARAYSLKAVVLDSKLYKGKRREDYDKELIDILQEHGVDPQRGLVILAGFMRILGKEFISKYKNRIMNIHPSLLPSFPGLEAQRQAWEYGVKVAGCTVHFVDEGIDTGPIILQAAVPVLEDDTPETLAARILEQEHRIYPEAIRLFAEGRLRIEGRRVRIL